MFHTLRPKVKVVAGEVEARALLTTSLISQPEVRGAVGDDHMVMVGEEFVFAWITIKDVFTFELCVYVSQKWL